MSSSCPPSSSSSSSSFSFSWASHLVPRPIFGVKYPWFSALELSRPPSTRLTSNPMTLAEDSLNRKYGGELISRLGEALKFPPIAIATASLYFQVFYMRHAFQEFPWDDICPVAVFLAGKVEESRTPMAEIVKPLLSLMPRPNVHPEQVRERLLKLEPQLLDAIEFKFNVEHPYEHIKPVVASAFADASKEFRRKYLMKSSEPGHQTVQMLTYLYVNDSLRTTLGLYYSPKVLVIGCVFAAIKFLRLDQPVFFHERSDASGSTVRVAVPWYLHLYGISTDHVQAITRRLESLLPNQQPPCAPHFQAPEPVACSTSSSSSSSTTTSSAQSTRRKRGQFPTELQTDSRLEPEVLIKADPDEKHASPLLVAPMDDKPPKLADGTDLVDKSADTALSTERSVKRKKHEAQPCPRCQGLFTKEEYAAHRDSCRAQFNKSKDRSNGKSKRNGDKRSRSSKVKSEHKDEKKRRHSQASRQRDSKKHKSRSESTDKAIVSPTSSNSDAIASVTLIPSSASHLAPVSAHGNGLHLPPLEHGEVDGDSEMADATCDEEGVTREQLATWDSSVTTAFTASSSAMTSSSSSAMIAQTQQVTTHNEWEDDYTSPHVSQPVPSDSICPFTPDLGVQHFQDESEGTGRLLQRYTHVHRTSPDRPTDQPPPPIGGSSPVTPLVAS